MHKLKLVGVQKIYKDKEAVKKISYRFTNGVYGLLGEQVDNQTMQPNWVVGLGWSHAMFILAIVEK